jgi:hypothetical protein
MGCGHRVAARILITAVAASSVLALTATSATAAKKRHLPTFTMANYSQLSNSPNAYKGAHVDISGKVFAIPPTGSKKLSAVQMWMDPDNDQYNTLVVYKTTNLKPQVGDYLHVVGTAAGVYKYKNAFGARDTAVEVGARRVTETDQAATEPPISSTGTTLTSCAIDQFSNTDVDITGSITNPSSTTYNYDISIAVISGGVRVGTAEEFEDPVAPNQPTTWSTSSEITGGNGTVTCQILSVSRTTPS